MSLAAEPYRRTLQIMTAGKPKPLKKSAGFNLGRKTWAKISAIEGVKLSKESEAMFAELDRLGLSPAERRERIIRKYTKPKK